MSKVSRVPEHSLVVRGQKESLALHRMGFEAVKLYVEQSAAKGVTEIILEAGAPYDPLKSQAEKYESLVSLEAKIQNALEKTAAGATIPVAGSEVDRLTYRENSGSFVVKVDGSEQAKELLSQIAKDIAPSYENLQVLREQVEVQYPDRPRPRQFGEAVMKEISAIKKELGASLGNSITLSDGSHVAPSTGLGNVASPGGKSFTRG